jgi:hypothetical protein
LTISQGLQESKVLRAENPIALRQESKEPQPI